MVCINNVNAFKLAGIVDDRCIANLRHFPSLKLPSMKNYIKPTLREFGPEHVILDVGTNNLNLPLSSSNINEVIRAVLNFFYEKILYAQRAQKAPKSTNKHQKHKKTQKSKEAKEQNANKRKKIKNAPQKHLSEEK